MLISIHHDFFCSENIIYNVTRFGAGNSSRVVKDLLCSGGESDIDQCSSYPWIITTPSATCSSNKNDVGINCSKWCFRIGTFTFVYHHTLFYIVQVTLKEMGRTLYCLCTLTTLDILTTLNISELLSKNGLLYTYISTTW